MKRLSEEIELLIAVEVATSGIGLYLKNNWNNGTCITDACKDYVNLKFEIIARKIETGKLHKTEAVRIKDDVNDLDYSDKLSVFYPTKITRYLPYSALAVKNLNYIVGDLKGLAAKLTELFAKKPINTTKALEKMF